MLYQLSYTIAGKWLRVIYDVIHDNNYVKQEITHLRLDRSPMIWSADALPTELQRGWEMGMINYDVIRGNNYVKWEDNHLRLDRSPMIWSADALPTRAKGQLTASCRKQNGN